MGCHQKICQDGKRGRWTSPRLEHQNAKVNTKVVIWEEADYSWIKLWGTS